MKRFLACSLLVFAYIARLDAQTCNPNIRETTPTSRFVLHGDGTATDTRTGLMWKRCAELRRDDCSFTSPPVWLTWEQALQRASDATDAGYSDWRLPNIQELLSIVDRSCYAPAINLSVFPNMTGGWFWTSSADAYLPGYAWVVDFYYGSGFSQHRDDDLDVRLVRGGQ